MNAGIVECSIDFDKLYTRLRSLCAHIFSTEEKVRLCICEDNIHVHFAHSTADFSQGKRLRRRLRRQPKRDRKKKWASRAKEFEKACEDSMAAR
ncbi:hypothetical protein RB195_014366 [Necator americanus]|uniref:Uncharacterized protein n=1 Tax=Necator americanus TaxID=51031 RepID=A0ABR1DZS5_NECAM